MHLATFQKEWLEEALAPGVSAAVLGVPRGNGKSTFLAALALWALFDDDPTVGAPQIPIIAVTVNQAVRSTYGVALSMRQTHPELEQRSLRYSAIGNQNIKTPYNNGEMFPVASDVDGLQGLDPSFAIADEIGFLPIESWNALSLASGKRPSSLVVGIGTPGYDRHNALWYLRSTLRQGIDVPGFYYKEFAAPEGCAVDDEDAWNVANPALAEGYMNIDAMRTAVLTTPDASFRILRLGQWVDGVESWLGDDGRKLWDSLKDPYDFMPGVPTYIGVDVALKRDSTAIVWCQRREDGRLHAKARIWHPTPDGKLDVTDAMQHIRELCTMYDVKQVGFDPRFFDLPAEQLAEEGYPMVEMPQSLERMTPAVGATYEAIKRGEITHDGATDFSEQVLNAVTKYNERGFTLAKAKAKGRIDSCIALCLATHDALGLVPAKTKYVIY